MGAPVRQRWDDAAKAKDADSTGERATVTAMPRIARYRILTRIGQGGAAELFAGRMPGEGGFEKLVAIKYLRGDHVVDFAEADSYERMLLDEARLAALVRSPHVVSPLEVGRCDEGRPYIAYELIVGGCLRDWLRAHRRGAPPPLGVGLEWVAQAADGLHDAHKALSPRGEPLHLVHRDVSPANVLLGLDGLARICDFGVAKAEGRLAGTTPGMVKGKLGYLSPEQATQGTTDHRSDIFALGVVAWETVTACRLFARATPADTLAALLDQPIMPPQVVRPEVPSGISHVIMTALRRNPHERYPTAGAFAIDLRRELRRAGLETDRRGLADEARHAFGPEAEKLLALLREDVQRVPESGIRALVPRARTTSSSELTPPERVRTSGVVVRPSLWRARLALWLMRIATKLWPGVRLPPPAPTLDHDPFR